MKKEFTCPRHRGALLSRSLAVLVSLLIARTSQAKVWNAHELLVGEWELELRGGWFFSPSQIFPRCSTSGEEGGKDVMKNFSTRKRPWGSSLPCSLSLCSDGTFLLRPKGVENGSGRLPMRGHWDVLSNPYCITDRFYDQLRLKSLPRGVSLASSSTGETDKVVLPCSGTMDLSCRVWGRHVRSQTVGRKGSITHGTVLWKEEVNTEKEEDGSSRTKASSILSARRSVLASFSAIRRHRESTIQGWEDQAIFGY